MRRQSVHMLAVCENQQETRKQTDAVCMFFFVLIKQKNKTCFLFCRLWVGVEDAQSETHIPVILLVSPHMTIAQLKDKVQMLVGGSAAGLSLSSKLCVFNVALWTLKYESTLRLSHLEIIRR